MKEAAPALDRSTSRDEKWPEALRQERAPATRRQGFRGVAAHARQGGWPCRDAWRTNAERSGGGRVPCFNKCRPLISGPWRSLTSPTTSLPR